MTTEQSCPVCGETEPHDHESEETIEKDASITSTPPVVGDLQELVRGTDDS